MRYELRLTAFDMLDQIHIAAALYETPDDPEAPTARVWAQDSHNPQHREIRSHRVDP